MPKNIEKLTMEIETINQVILKTERLLEKQKLSLKNLEKQKIEIENKEFIDLLRCYNITKPMLQTQFIDKIQEKELNKKNKEKSS